MKICGTLFCVLFLVSMGWSLEGACALDRRQALTKKTNAYIEEGVFTGGEAGKGFSLLGIRRHYAKKTKLERIVLDLGDTKGQALLGKVSYFNISVSRKPHRVVIDLAQVLRSGVTQDQIQKIFRRSPYVKKAVIRFDPEDQSSNILLELSRSVSLEVFSMPSKRKKSRIVLDFKPHVTNKGAKTETL